MATRIEEFGLEPGDSLGPKYEVIRRIGSGWEGETYLLRERYTGGELAAKLFFPQRNARGAAARRYARKLYKLRNCPILVQYHTQESVRIDGQTVVALVSEYVPGEPLHEFLRRQRGGRLSPFQGMHLLHALAQGMEAVHAEREYHGDLHEGNIIVRRHGLSFDLKVLDLFDRGKFRVEEAREDLLSMVRVFYDAVGGPKHYSRQPQQVKEICRGLRRGLILQRFRSVAELRAHLENLRW